MKYVSLIALLICMAGCRSTSNIDVVSSFSVDAYMGTWYEAVRYPHRFEKGMSHVSATYSLNEDGTIEVLNRGFNERKQEWEEIQGVAKPKGNDGKGWLKVSFFKPFYASYKIIYLDEAYSKAIVTGPTYGYLWILVRNPELPEAELEELIERSEAFGFNREKMIIVEQTENKS